MKYNVLFEAFKKEDAISFGNIPDSLVEKENQLIAEIAYYEKIKFLKDDEISKENRNDLLLNLFNLKNELSEIQEIYKNKFPNYFALKFAPNFVNIDQLQNNILTSDQTIVEYFVGDSSIFIFTIQKNKYDILELKKDFPLEDWVKEFQQGIYGYYTKSAQEQTDQLYKEKLLQFNDISQKLYDKLILPIKDKLTTKELIIIPDGTLGNIPFGCLISNTPKKINNFKSYPFLEKEFQVSYCYSATLLREMKEKQFKEKSRKSLVAFAPFFEETYAKTESTIDLQIDTLKSGQDTTLLTSRVNRKDFKLLPGSGEEVNIACKLWDGDSYLGALATESQFNKVAGDYQIIHLSTHGVADNRFGDYSYLAFAEVQDSIENEFLYVRDLYGLQLNADLVVLSACETAVGEFQKGEGIISLARAFTYAGSKSIVTSLWVADDEMTKELMSVFYQQLKDGVKKDQALQMAKLSILNNNRNAHPFFWAGFIPIGDMSALK